MNNETQKRANRSPRSKTRSKVAMPKARVMYQNVFGELSRGLYHGGGWDLPCSVKPHPTKSAAQAKVRFNNSSWEEKRERIAQVLRKAAEPKWDRWVSWRACIDKEFWRERATAVLHALGERPEREEK